MDLSALIGEGVLEGICHEFIDNQTDGQCFVRRQQEANRTAGEGNRLLAIVERQFKRLA